MTDESVVLETIETNVDLKRKELEKINVEIEEKKAKLKKMERREISAEERAISDKQVTSQVKGSALKEKIEKQKAHDDKMLTGRFINRRHPGKKSEKLTYLKYDTDPVKWWDFEDGKVYTIPQGFVEQIKEHYYVPYFTQKQGPMDPNQPASQIHHIDTSNKKYDFVPVNF